MSREYNKECETIDEFVQECTKLAQKLATDAKISPVDVDFSWGTIYKRITYQPPRSDIDTLRIENEKLKKEIDQLRERNKRQRGWD